MTNTFDKADLSAPRERHASISALAWNRPRFESSRDAGSYLGFRPKRRDSGERRPQLRITKEGDVYLRMLSGARSTLHFGLAKAGYRSEAVGTEVGIAWRQECEKAGRSSGKDSWFLSGRTVPVARNSGGVFFEAVERYLRILADLDDILPTFGQSIPTGGRPALRKAERKRSKRARHDADRKAPGQRFRGRAFPKKRLKRSTSVLHLNCGGRRTT